RITELLHQAQAWPMITVGVGFELLNPGNVVSERLPHFSSIAEEAGCAHPDLWPSYLNNLSRLGLVEMKEGALMGHDDTYKMLIKHPTVASYVSQIETVGLGFAASRNEFIQLTPL